MTLTRRAFFKGMLATAAALALRRQLDGVIDSLWEEHELDAASEMDVLVTPQIPFRPRRLVVSTECAADFVITHMRVDRVEHAYCAVPAALFTAPNPYDVGLALPVLAPARSLSVGVRYVGSDPDGARFIATMIGDAMTEGRLRTMVLPLYTEPLGRCQGAARRRRMVASPQWQGNTSRSLAGVIEDGDTL